MNPISTFYPRPLGVAYHTTQPEASRASLDTSRELVHEHEPDAAYFRALEQAGILLNQPQIDAVRYGQGPLLTLAGAGCGKTTVLAARAGYLITVRGVAPSSLLLVTFTSKAAAEMKERIAALPGIRPAAAKAVQARTFHSFALALLRHQGVQEEIFGDTQAQHTVMKMLLRRLRLSDAMQPETILSALSAWKGEGRQVEELPESTPEETDLKQVVLGYEEWKRDRHKMDFDDILLRAASMMRDPDILRPLQRRFSYIMVDEFQDTNVLQYEMVRRLAAPHRNLMVVGDDDQTIYTFNGARQESILEFDRVYPGAKIITLNINYRSDPRILGLGSRIIAANRRRRKKTLMSAGPGGLEPQYFTPAQAEEEAAHVIQHLTQQVEEGTLRYADIAILHRTASASRAIFEQLVMREIPFVQYGASSVFYDQSLIRPLMDHLRLALNPRLKEALPSVLGPLYVPRETGLDYLQAEDRKQPKKYPLIHLTRWDRLQSFQHEQVKERIRLIKNLAGMKPVAAIQEMRRTFYDKYLESGDPGTWTHYKETIQESLEELETAAQRFETVEEFVGFANELTKRHQEMEQLRAAADGDALHLMTIHRAKGLEFPCVYWIGASEGLLPHSSALASQAPEDLRQGQATAGSSSSALSDTDALLEEERRLAYVAVTRAKHMLYITSPASHHGKPAAVSRFLLEAYGVKQAPSRPSTPQPEAKERISAGRSPRTITIPVWVCPDAACGAWMRQDTRGAAGASAASSAGRSGASAVHQKPGQTRQGAASQAGQAGVARQTTRETPPACPLCSAVMQTGTRAVPAR